MARMRDKQSARRSGGTVRIPGMKGVEGKVLIPEGDYLAEVTSVETKEGNVSDYLEFQFTITEGEFEGRKLYDNLSLSPQALWNLRGLMETLGLDPPDEDEDMDIEDFVGKMLILTVSHDTYKGKKKTEITDWQPEGKGNGKSKKRSSKKDEDSDDGEDEDDKKSARRSGKSERRSSRRSEEKEDAGDDEDSKPSRSSRGSKGSKKEKDVEKVAQDDVLDMNEDELADLVKEHDLDVDMDVGSLKKRKSLVIAALEEVGALEE